MTINKYFEYYPKLFINLKVLSFPDGVLCPNPQKGIPLNKDTETIQREEKETKG